MEFLGQKHEAFFRRMLFGMLPPACEAEQVRVVLCYFALRALESMGTLNLSDPQRRSIADWVISTQFGRVGRLREDFNIACVYAALGCLVTLRCGLESVPTDEVVACVAQLQHCDGADSKSDSAAWMHGAVCARLPRPAEADVRYVYAAAATCSFLGRWDCLDVAAAASFVARCQSYEGGFGLCPGQEAHGGSTYCSLAALDLLGCAPLPPSDVPTSVAADSGSARPLLPLLQPHRASAALSPVVVSACRRIIVEHVDSAALARWLSLRTVSLAAASELNGASDTGRAAVICDGDDSDNSLLDDDPRYRGGISGRAGKPADTCYAWWCGGARLVLQRSADQPCRQWPQHWTDSEALGEFLLRCQFHAGGCGKDWEALPDPLHSCYGIVGACVPRSDVAWFSGRLSALVVVDISISVIILFFLVPAGLTALCHFGPQMESSSEDGAKPDMSTAMLARTSYSLDDLVPSLGVSERALLSVRSFGGVSQ